MLCERCHQREAAVHLTSCTAGEDQVSHRNFCAVCFPWESLSREEQEAAIRKLFGVPPAAGGDQPRDGTTRAFTLTELLIVLAGLAFLALIFLPAVAKSKARSAQANCNIRVRQITLACRMWALDNNGRPPMQVSVTNGGTLELVASGKVYPHFQVMSNELSTPKVLLCPADEKRSFATNFTSDLTDSKLSYFLNLDATNEDGSSLLCGDRNLTNRAPAGGRLVALTKAAPLAWTREMHSQKGNLGFADSRVDFFSNGSVGAALKSVQGATNWLAVP